MEASVELDKYKREIKEEIKQLINSGNLDAAVSVISEYERIVSDDIEIMNMKAVIRMLRGDTHGAGMLLWQAIENNHANADTFYNLAYTRETEGDYTLAYRFYKKAQQLADDVQLVQDAEAALRQLELHLERPWENETKRFIILSSCNWGIMLQRPHHIASALAQFGHIVDYVQPERQMAAAGNANVSVEEAVSFSKNMANQQGLIQIYSPLTLHYGGKVILDNYLGMVQDLIDNSTEEVVIICYLPNAIDVLDKLNGDFTVVYECVDDHNDLEYSFWNNKRDREYEMKLVEQADFITTTSTALYLSKCMNRSNVYLSKNAVNRDDFRPDSISDIPEDLRSIPGPKVCYMGAVYDWFHEELFYEAVRSNRDISFVVIGPVKTGMLTEKEDNLYVLGPKRHADLKRYLLHMDAGIIPFRDDADIVVNCDPIKSYEYVSCGLPVIATNMPELATGKEFIKITNGFGEFNRAVRESLNLKLSEEQIDGFLSENDWMARGRQILDILNGHHDEYGKDIVLARMKHVWSKIVAEGRNPLVESIYALTFAESNPLKFLEHASAAYEKLKTSFTLKCYVYAALLNDRVEECVAVVLKDRMIADLVKSELLYLQKHGRLEAIRIRMIYIAKAYELLHPEISKLQEEEQRVEWAHFYYEMADHEKAETLYSNLLNTRSEYLNSPMVNWNLADLLIRIGALKESQSFREIAKASIAQYMVQDRAVTGNAQSSKKRTRFSVVIPTRNSRDTLEFTLKTCLDQSFDDYEVVVSDNSSNDLTKQLIDRLDDPRIKYVRPDRELPMTENFNYALSHATGEYVIVLGSDDGLLFHALNTLNALLDSFQTKLISWNLLAYGWPDVNLEGYQNYFGIPSVISGKVGHRYVKGRDVIRAVSQYDADYSVLPMLYCNSVVHADLLAELMKKTGSIYKSLSPDIYSGFALAYLQESYLFIDIPISIGGSSGNSNGISTIFGKNKKAEQIKNDYFRLNNQDGLQWHSMIPDVKALEVAVGDSFMRAKEALFPNDRELELNRKKMIKNCAEALVKSDPETTGKLYNLYHSLEDDTELQHWFYETYLESPNAPGRVSARKFEYKKGFMDNGSGLIVDAMDFGVKDVYGAADLFRKLTGW